MKALVLAGLALAVSAGTAFAQSTPLIDARERNQAHRIFNGVRSGDLSFGETARLVRGQVHVHNLERRAKADGVVTPIERLRVNFAQTRQGNRIYRLRHN